MPALTLYFPPPSPLTPLHYIDTPFFSRLFYHHPLGYPWLSSRDFGLRERCAASTCFSSSSSSTLFFYLFIFLYILFLSRRNWPVIRYTHTYRERERRADRRRTVATAADSPKEREEEENKIGTWKCHGRWRPDRPGRHDHVHFIPHLFSSFSIFQTYTHTHTIQSYNHHMLDIKRENKMEKKTFISSLHVII